MAKDLEFRLSISPVAVGVISSLGTGIYTGLKHAAGQDASYVPALVSTAVHTLACRNEVNPRRGNRMAQANGKKTMTIAGAATGVVLNAVGYGIGRAIGYAINN